MTERAAAPIGVEFSQLRGPIRWRRWLGLSLPLAIGLVFILAGALADVLAPYDPSFIDLSARLLPPVFDGGAWDHPLGTDDVGRDILSRLMHGARISLIVVAIVVPSSAAVGTLVGMTSGWMEGVTGQILMRIVDVQLALPAILFAVLLGRHLRAEPAQRDHHFADLDMVRLRPTGSRGRSCRCGNATSRRRHGRWGPASGGSCASTCCPTS